MKLLKLVPLHYGGSVTHTHQNRIWSYKLYLHRKTQYYSEYDLLWFFYMNPLWNKIIIWHIYWVKSNSVFWGTRSRIHRYVAAPAPQIISLALWAICWLTLEGRGIVGMWTSLHKPTTPCNGKYNYSIPHTSLSHYRYLYCLHCRGGGGLWFSYHSFIVILAQ